MSRLARSPVQIGQPANRPTGEPTRGFTLVEIVLGAVTMAIVTTAVLGAYVGQITLNEHAKNLSRAIQDANRVIEAIRDDNAGCNSTPDLVPDDGSASWDQWMSTGGAGAPKSIQPNPDTEELIVVTCQDKDGTGYCGSSQVGTGEWHAAGSTANPLRVTVAVCWRHRGRTIGECAWDGTTLSADDDPDDGVVGVIESPAMLTTLVTCR